MGTCKKENNWVLLDTSLETHLFIEAVCWKMIFKNSPIFRSMFKSKMGLYNIPHSMSEHCSYETN